MWGGGALQLTLSFWRGEWGCVFDKTGCHTPCIVFSNIPSSAFPLGADMAA